MCCLPLTWSRIKSHERKFQPAYFHSERKRIKAYKSASPPKLEIRMNLLFSRNSAIAYLGRPIETPRTPAYTMRHDLIDKMSSHAYPNYLNFFKVTYYPTGIFFCCTAILISHWAATMTTATLTPGLDGQLEKGVDIENNNILESTSPSSDSIQKEQYGSPAELEPAAPRTVTGIRWFLICVAIFSANILYGLDTTIAADIQAAVSETFGDVALLGWLGVGFTLGSTVAILPLGKIFGNFDVKWVFLGCLTMFAAGSALCGGAPSMNAIIVGRVWAGVGGAGMYLGYGRPVHDLTISDN
jgi:hypothetical protein